MSVMWVKMAPAMCVTSLRVAPEKQLGVSAMYNIFLYLKGPSVKYDYDHLMRVSMDKIEEYFTL